MRDERLRRERRIEFLGEQVGAAEDELKRSLLDVLHAHGRVERAYLAVVGFQPSSDRAVALCIAPAIAESRRLVDEVEVAFAQIFSAEAHLDVIFLSRENEADLSRVCQPFYGL